MSDTETGIAAYESEIIDSSSPHGSRTGRASLRSWALLSFIGIALLVGAALGLYLVARHDAVRAFEIGPPKTMERVALSRVRVSLDRGLVICFSIGWTSDGVAAGEVELWSTRPWRQVERIAIEEGFADWWKTW